MQQIDEHGGLFKKTGQVNYAAIGSVAGGALGSIVPGLGTALGAALGGGLGSMVKGGVHDGKDIKEEVKKEINRVLSFHTQRANGDSEKLLKALEKAAQAKIDHAKRHGANSKAKSSKQFHEARKVAFEILLKEVQGAKIPTMQKMNEPDGSTGSYSSYPSSEEATSVAGFAAGDEIKIGGWGITPPNQNQKKSVLEKIKAWYHANKDKPVIKYTAWGLLGAGVVSLVLVKFVFSGKKGRKIGR